MSVCLSERTLAAGGSPLLLPGPGWAPGLAPRQAGAPGNNGAMPAERSETHPATRGENARLFAESYRGHTPQPRGKGGRREGAGRNHRQLLQGSFTAGIDQPRPGELHLLCYLQSLPTIRGIRRLIPRAITKTRCHFRALPQI